MVLTRYYMIIQSHVLRDAYQRSTQLIKRQRPSVKFPSTSLRQWRSSAVNGVDSSETLTTWDGDGGSSVQWTAYETTRCRDGI